MTTVEVTQQNNTVEIQNGPTVVVPGSSVSVVSVAEQGPQGVGFTGVKGGHFTFKTVINDTFALQASAREAYTINSIQSLKTDSGSVDITISINGTPVTGLENITATTSSQNVTATANNTVSVGDRVTITTSNNSSATKLEFSLDGTV